ncbi:MAG: DUF4411 family protein [Actinobacteria bacterium]|nr:DUF4411 family protein [Actinomycetota bacterium]
MPDHIIYCVDSNILIDLNRNYPEQVFPTIYTKIDGLANNGRFIITEKVNDEIEKGIDELIPWVKAHSYIVVPIDDEQISIVKQILQRYPQWIDINKESEDADPWIVALAVQKNRKLQIIAPENNCIIVTNESQNLKRLKIPYICQNFGIDCIKLLEMFRRENWNF